MVHKVIRVTKVLMANKDTKVTEAIKVIRATKEKME